MVYGLWFVVCGLWFVVCGLCLKFEASKPKAASRRGNGKQLKA
jgi:hypothetical protein